MANILKRQQEEVGRLTAQLDELSKSRMSLDDTLVRTNQELDEAIERQDSLQEEVSTRLRENASFVQLSDRAAMAEAAIERAEANLAEIEQDAARKLPAYDNSKLFHYLHDQGFGTDAYTKRGFTRRMDRILAKYIGYREAKQGYDFLKKTPEQMRQIIGEDRTSLDVVMIELEKCRDEVAAEVGLTGQVNAVADLMTRRTSVIDDLNRVLNDVNEKQQAVAKASDPHGPRYVEAIDVFRDMLARIHKDDLKRRARDTIDITDDQIVARLEGVEGQIEQLDDVARSRRDDLVQRQRLIADLGQMIQQFRAAGFDSARSQFVGSFDVVTEVGRAMDHGSMETLWQAIRTAQRWGPSTMEKIGQVARHPMTQVLINAMAHAAGGALEAHARRAGNRGRRGGGARFRRGGNSSSWGPWESSRW